MLMLPAQGASSGHLAAQAVGAGCAEEEFEMNIPRTGRTAGATAAAGDGGWAGIVVRVGQRPGEADVCGTDNRALQAAVDYVARAGGGAVLIGPGTYLMLDSLHLRSGVAIRGSGPATVLRKCDAAVSRLVLDGDYGEEQITVADASGPMGFAPGVGVAVWDDRSGGFHTTVATLLEGPLPPAVPEEALGYTFRVSGAMQSDYLVKRDATA